MTNPNTQEQSSTRRVKIISVLIAIATTLLISLFFLLNLFGVFGKEVELPVGGKKVDSYYKINNGTILQLTNAPVNGNYVDPMLKLSALCGFISTVVGSYEHGSVIKLDQSGNLRLSKYFTTNYELDKRALEAERVYGKYLPENVMDLILSRLKRSLAFDNENGSYLTLYYLNLDNKLDNFFIKVYVDAERFEEKDGNTVYPYLYTPKDEKYKVELYNKEPLNVIGKTILLQPVLARLSVPQDYFGTCKLSNFPPSSDPRIIGKR